MIYLFFRLIICTISFHLKIFFYMTFEYLLGAPIKARNICSVTLKISLQVGVSKDLHHGCNSNTFLTLQNKIWKLCKNLV